MMPGRGRQRVDEIEATLRDLGVPDIERWRRRVDATQEAYERVDPLRRWLWRLMGTIDSIRARVFIRRRAREREAAAHDEFLVQHPDYADALRRGDRAAARDLLAEILVAERVGLWRSESFGRFLLGGLRARGFNDDDLEQVRTMLDNMRRGGPEN